MPRVSSPTKARSIRTKTDRDALPVSRTPVWERISKGRRLGYRKQDDVWVAAARNDDGGYTSCSLGRIDDYAKALAAANAWFDGRHGVASAGRLTVEQACRLYVDDRRHEKGESAAQDAEGRFRRLVYGRAFGKQPLDSLTPAQCSAFRNSLAPLGLDGDELRAAKVTANRNWATVKGALNWAHGQHMTSKAPWQVVTAFSKVSARRELFLTVEQRRALLNALPGDVRRFAMAMLLTAARPGELFAANVADFDRVAGTLTIRKSKTSARVCVLSSAACEFFRDVTRDRIGNVPLFIRDVPAVRKDGTIDHRLDKEHVKRFMRRAAKAAGLPPEVVAYALRHAAISEMLLGGMDATVVAILAGTSTSMIQRNYAHLQGQKMRDQLDRVRVI